MFISLLPSLMNLTTWERPREGGQVVSLLVHVAAPCSYPLTQCGTGKLCHHPSSAWCNVPVPLCASWGLSGRGLALPNAKHLQTGLSNNWLSVLSFCGFIQVTGCGAGLFPLATSSGVVDSALDLGSEAGCGSQPCPAQPSDAGLQLPSA